MNAMSSSLRKHVLSTLLIFSIVTVVLPELVSGVSVASVVTTKFFNGIKSQTWSGCKGKSFYTRTAFLDAAKSFPSFGHDKTVLVSKREIAAFFAQITHETGQFCYIEEIAKSRYCNLGGCSKYPCTKGKQYYGRGPIQITWNCNYGAAGKYLGLDLLHHPELVATNPTVSFKTALWYWQTRVRPVLKDGFGATIRAINGGECNGGSPKAVASRVSYYKKYCKQFGITPGPNVSC